MLVEYGVIGVQGGGEGGAMLEHDTTVRLMRRGEQLGGSHEVNTTYYSIFLIFTNHSHEYEMI